MVVTIARPIFWHAEGNQPSFKHINQRLYVAVKSNRFGIKNWTLNRVSSRLGSASLHWTMMMGGRVDAFTIHEDLRQFDGWKRFHTFSYQMVMNLMVFSGKSCGFPTTINRCSLDFGPEPASSSLLRPLRTGHLRRPPSPWSMAWKCDAFQVFQAWVKFFRACLGPS